MSLAVSTAMTSGARRTASRSIACMRPRAASAKPGTTCTVPTGSRRSSMKAAVPRTWAATASCGQDCPSKPGSGPVGGTARRPESLSETFKDHLPRLRDAGRCGCGTAHLGQCLEQQRLGRFEAIGGGGTLVVRRGEILRQHVDHGGPGTALGKTDAAQAAFGEKGALRHGGKPAEGNARGGDDAAFESEAEGAEHDGAIIVVAPGHLVAAEKLVHRKLRHFNQGDELAAALILPAGPQEVFIDRQAAEATIMPELERRPESHQDRRQVGDRVGSGDV